MHSNRNLRRPWPAALTLLLLVVPVSTMAQAPYEENLWPRLFWAGFYNGYTHGMADYPTSGVWQGRGDLDCYEALAGDFENGWARSWAGSGTSWDNYILQARVLAVDGEDANVGLVYRQIDRDNFYLFVLENRSTARLMKSVDGNLSEIASAAFDYAADEWHVLRVATVGIDHYAAIDGELVMMASDGTFMRGTGGVAARLTDAHFDDVWCLLNPHIGRDMDGPKGRALAEHPFDPDEHPDAYEHPLFHPMRASAWQAAPGAQPEVTVFPNPFVQSTSLKLRIPNASVSELNVYDTSGRLVRTLISAEALETGQHFMSWDGRNAGGQPARAGVYFCVLRTEQGEATAKLFLQR